MDKAYDKVEIIEKLKSEEVFNFIKKYNIITMLMFGSIVSDDLDNEFNEESDVDIALLASKSIELDSILEIELFFQNLLNREIDVLDLRSESLDIFVKISILNTGKIIFTEDNGMSLEILYNETDRIYRENENFMYFRKVDVLS
ncbi:nucleotidyltransferase domain-containing protein [Clostridium sp. HMP27]|uniref:nucleotidyltransferase family protein n=1 Tax=Clostridium sp. HMP27 TaxID=1487921 RepID=UPI00052C7C9E|nr:nucleotidyltransferase domain-containing protein [Clostridium sp. HMP27]KGK85855.1 DNA polymerase III subunit beta [Clostridium sp. HMP27]